MRRVLQPLKPRTGGPGGDLASALVISRDDDRRSDPVVGFITSVAWLDAAAGTGLKVRSAVRFD